MHHDESSFWSPFDNMVTNLDVYALLYLRCQSGRVAILEVWDTSFASPFVRSDHNSSFVYSCLSKFMILFSLASLMMLIKGWIPFSGEQLSTKYVLHFVLNLAATLIMSPNFYYVLVWNHYIRERRDCRSWKSHSWTYNKRCLFTWGCHI